MADGGRELDAYRRKRHADRTPEPAGAAAAQPSEGPPVFVVQRHSARRLHFDLRLEAGGVLKSWAVPKGLPTTRGVRRLAVHTEDHPLEYATFEGQIPAGEYGAGTMDIYDRGTYELVEAKRDGGLTVRLDGERLQGEWTLVPAALDGDPRNWLLLNKSGPEEPPPAPRVQPMLASSGDRPARGDAWLHEVKWDGYRALARLADGEPYLWSRRGQDLAERFPRILNDLGRGLRSPNCVVDGEVVAFDEHGVPRFNLVQKAEGAISLLLFDVLELEGDDLCDLPLEQRREILEGLVDETSATVRLSRAFDDGEGLLAAARERGLEGVISKRRASKYVPGARSRDWVKVKAALRDWFPVIALRAGDRSRSRLGSLVVAREVDGELRYAGRVGSGLSEAEIDRILERLEPLVRDTAPVEVPAAAALRAASPALGRGRLRGRGRVRRGQPRRPAAPAALRRPARARGLTRTARRPRPPAGERGRREVVRYQAPDGGVLPPARSSGFSTSPRQPPVGAPRASTRSLKRCRSPFTRRSSKPSALPAFSTRPSGSCSICTITRVWLSFSRWNVTTPAFSVPSVLRQAMRWSGCCSVISASHSRRAPPMSATQCRRLSSICWTDSMPSMKVGNSSNCVHWSYATRTGTSMSMWRSTVVTAFASSSVSTKQASRTAHAQTGCRASSGTRRRFRPQVVGDYLAERFQPRRHPVQHVWKGFIVGATVGAGIGLLLDVMERAGEAGRELAEEARGAAQELATEARMRAPDVKEAAQSAASTLADQATVAASKAKEAVSDRASSTMSSVRS